ncbi:N-acetylmuramidase family protein [Pseudomonas baltica]|uniref:N-acetylmuramidase family protein n=1 Tax=Pseudomonas baltica TaxID=2762576 RepID=UPI00289E1CC9|nr:N-acetylmuramidase family protein [Pseudomonas baltica]
MNSLQHGDRNQDVCDLQRALTKAGFKVADDGYFGDSTESAVRAYQARKGLVADGIAGPKTIATINGVEAPGLLSQAALAVGAQRLGVELAAILAVNEVESQGAGFLPNGKPKILYERHIMYRQLQVTRSTQDDASELKARADKLCVAQPNLVNTAPGGYSGGTAEHQRLANAKLIDETSALESASWGAFQIMGFHAVRLGYPSVQAFAGLMAQDENEQFEAFIRFIEADPALLKALRGKKWAAFAKAYNGPDYLRNLYDTKLERAYDRHASASAVEVAA